MGFFSNLTAKKNAATSVASTFIKSVSNSPSVSLLSSLAVKAMEQPKQPEIRKEDKFFYERAQILHDAGFMQAAQKFQESQPKYKNTSISMPTTDRERFEGQMQRARNAIPQLAVEIPKGIFRFVIETGEFADPLFESTLGRVSDAISGAIRGEKIKPEEKQKVQEAKRKTVETVQKFTAPDKDLGWVGGLVNYGAEWAIPGGIGVKTVSKVPAVVGKAQGLMKDLRLALAGAAVSDPTYVAIKRKGEENEKTFAREAMEELTYSGLGTALFVLAPAGIRKGISEVFQKKGLQPEVAEEVADKILPRVLDMKNDLTFGERRLAFKKDQDPSVNFGEKRMTQTEPTGVPLKKAEDSAILGDDITKTKMTIDDQAREAVSKGMSKEEFVKKQPKVYKGVGGNNKFQGNEGLFSGIHFTESKKRASEFGDVSEYIFDKNLKIKDIDLTGLRLEEAMKKLGVDDYNIFSDPKKMTQILKDNGYDGVNIKQTNADKQIVDNIIIFDPKVIKTRSQLESAYDKAKGATTPPSKDTEGVTVRTTEPTPRNLGTEENKLLYLPLQEEIKLLPPSLSGDNWVATKPVEGEMTVKGMKAFQKQETKRILAEENIQKKKDKTLKMLGNNQNIRWKKKKAKEAGLEYDFRPMEKEYLYQQITKKNLRSSKEIDEMIATSKKKGVSQEVIDDFEIFGHKLKDIEVIKNEENGVISAVSKKDMQETKRILAEGIKQKKKDETLEMLGNNQDIKWKKEKAKEAGLEYDFRPMEKEYLYKQITKKNLRSSKEIDEMIATSKEKGVSQEAIDDFEIFGHKLKDIEVIKKEENGVISAVWTKKDMSEMIDNYKSTLSEKQINEIKSGYIMDKGARRKTKDFALGMEEPQLFFSRIGMKNIYDIVRGGAGRVGGRRGVGARLMVDGARVLPDFDKLSLKEAENVWKAVAIRQRYFDGEIQLTPKEQKALDTFDEWNKEVSDEFFKVAEMNGVNVGRVDGFFPMRTKQEYQNIKEGKSQWDRALKNYSEFASTRERNKSAPMEIFETDVRKVMNQYIHDFAEFVEMGKVLPKVKAFIESDPVKKTMGERSGDYMRLQNWYKDMTTPEQFTLAMDALASGANFFRKNAARSQITSLSTGLKQFIPTFQMMITEGVLPSRKYKEIVDKFPSIFERQGGDFVINDATGKIDKVLFTIPRVLDAVSAKRMGGGLIEKEMRKNGFTDFYDLTELEQNIIINRVQDKIDFLYGGVTKEQLPEMYRKALGKHLFAFMRPTTSIFNYALKKGLDNGASGYAAGALFLLTGAYIEQVITNLSFKWGSVEDMAKDIAASFVSNFPGVSIFVYPFRTGRQVETSTTSGISNFMKKAYEFRNDTATWQEVAFAGAEMLGLPTQIRKTASGYTFVEEEGMKDKEGNMLAPMGGFMEGLRALYRGQYAPLAVQEYIENISRKTEERAWLHPEVEFFQNGDYYRKAEIYKQLGEEDGQKLYKNLSSGQQDELDDYLFAQKYSDVDSIIGLRQAMEKEGIYDNERLTMSQLYSHMKKSAILNGEDPDMIINMPKSWSPRRGVMTLSEDALAILNHPKVQGLTDDKMEAFEAILDKAVDDRAILLQEKEKILQLVKK